MTVSELRATMSHDEWNRWVSYYKIEEQRSELESKKAKAGMKG